MVPVESVEMEESEGEVERRGGRIVETVEVLEGAGREAELIL